MEKEISPAHILKLNLMHAKFGIF